MCPVHFHKDYVQGGQKKKKKYEKLKGERGGEKNDWEEGAA